MAPDTAGWPTVKALVSGMQVPARRSLVGVEPGMTVSANSWHFLQESKLHVLCDMVAVPRGGFAQAGTPARIITDVLLAIYPNCTKLKAQQVEGKKIVANLPNGILPSNINDELLLIIKQHRGTSESLF